MRSKLSTSRLRRVHVTGAMVLVTSLGLLGAVSGCRREPKKPTPTCVATVKGTCIERRMLRPAFRLFGTRGGGGMNELSGAKYVLQGVIDRELLAQEAEAQGIKVTDAELDESTTRGTIYVSTPVSGPVPPQFGLDAGRLELNDLKVPQKPPAEGEGEEGEKPAEPPPEEMTFEKRLKTFVNSTPAEFRTWQARELLAAKMRQRIKDGVKISDEDAFTRYVEERTTATVDYVFVYREWVEAYAVQIDPKAVDAWAAENPAKVIVPVRHILRTGDNEEELAKAKDEAQALLDRVKKGEDFATLAKEHSADPETKDKGGVYPGEMVQEFVEEFQAAVKKLKPGEMAPELVKTSYGYHIIKREPATHEANVKAYVKDRSDALAKTIGTEIHAAVTGGKTMAAAAAAAVAKYGKYGKGAAAAAADPKKPKLETSRAFTKTEEPLQLISPVAEKTIAEFGFKGEPGQLAPEVVTTWTGSIVVQAKGKHVPTKDEFAKDHDPFVAKLLAAKQEAEVRAHVKKLREDAKDQIVVEEDKLFPGREAGAPGGPPPGPPGSPPPGTPPGPPGSPPPGAPPGSPPPGAAPETHP